MHIAMHDYAIFYLPLSFKKNNPSIKRALGEGVFFLYIGSLLAFLVLSQKNPIYCKPSKHRCLLRLSILMIENRLSVRILSVRADGRFCMLA